MPSKILKYLKKCDIFGIQPQLYIKKASRHKSILGGFLSVLLILGFLGFVIYTLISLEQFNFSSIRSWDEFSPVNDFININEKNFLIMFRVSDQKALKMLRFTAVNEEYANSKLISKDEYPFLDCNNTTFSSFEYDYKTIINPEEFKCLQLGPNGLQLGGEDDSKNLKRFYLTVASCEGESNCLDSEQLNEFFSQGDIS